MQVHRQYTKTKIIIKFNSNEFIDTASESKMSNLFYLQIRKPSIGIVVNP